MPTSTHNEHCPLPLNQWPWQVTKESTVCTSKVDGTETKSPNQLAKKEFSRMRNIKRNSRDIQDQGMNTAETEYNTISQHSMAKYYEKIIWGHWSSEESHYPLRST